MADERLPYSAHKTKFAMTEALMIMESSQDKTFLHQLVSTLRVRGPETTSREMR